MNSQVQTSFDSVAHSINRKGSKSEILPEKTNQRILGPLTVCVYRPLADKAAKLTADHLGWEPGVTVTWTGASNGTKLRGLGAKRGGNKKPAGGAFRATAWWDGVCAPLTGGPRQVHAALCGRHVGHTPGRAWARSRPRGPHPAS